MEEIWKDIKKYEGLYQVSNLGRVKSLERIRKNGKNNFYLKKERLLKQATQNIGYKFVVLYKDNGKKGYRVHRLVAETFIPNPNNYNCINHKDECRTNNKVDNLEWCTISYNNSYGTKLERYRKNLIKKIGRKVNQYDLNGNFIKQWDCIMDIERHLKKKRASSPICACCRNKKPTAYGFKWCYENQV